MFFDFFFVVVVLKMEGVSYRGRVLIEVNMDIGKPPAQRYEDIKIVDLNKLSVSGILCNYSLFFSLWLYIPCLNASFKS